MALVTTYTVTYDADEDGWWVADVPALAGAHTQARTIETAHERIREVIALVTGEDPAGVEVLDDVHLPPAVAAAVDRARAARRMAEEAQRKAMKATAAAAVAVVTGSHHSTRDAARILGVSHGRVHQLVGPRRGRAAI